MRAHGVSDGVGGGGGKLSRGMQRGQSRHGAALADGGVAGRAGVRVWQRRRRRRVVLA